jgi:hypothetical protein
MSSESNTGLSPAVGGTALPVRSCWRAGPVVVAGGALPPGKQRHGWVPSTASTPSWLDDMICHLGHLERPSGGGPCFFAIHNKRCEQDESMACAHAHIALSTPGSEVGQGIMVMLRLPRVSGLPNSVGRGPPAD